MISQCLWKKRSNESILRLVCDVSVESDVLSIHEWIFRWGQQPLYIRSLSLWSVLIMGHMRVLKRKSRSEVQVWRYFSSHSWSSLKKYSFEIEHSQKGEVFGNPIRIHSVHSKLNSFLEKLRINVSMYTFILTRWLSTQCLKPWDVFSQIMEMWLWTIEVHSNYYR